MNTHIFLILAIFLCSTSSCSASHAKTSASIANHHHQLVSDTLKMQTIAKAKKETKKDTSPVSKLNTIELRNDANDSISTCFANNVDSLRYRWYRKNTTSQYGYGKDSVNTRTNLNDSVYMSRFKQIPSPIVLSYNQIVKNYIELYVKKRRTQMEKMMGLSDYYFPIFEEILDKKDLPQELKYLPVIESGLNPKALSKAGASGLWQFMYRTGRMYKLEVNSFVDERRDPVKASHAAASFLKDLYEIYEDWHLVIAAYNCGPGNVNKAIRRSGGKRNYWDIYYHLPKETRGYVPAFIAVVYAFNFHKEHDLYPSENDFPVACDTLMIKESLHFDQISGILPISKEQLRSLNPQYRADILPGDKAYPLRLPINLSSKFMDLQDAVFAYKKDKYFSSKDKLVDPGERYQKHAHVTPKNKAKVNYTVKSGDAVGLIASWFKVRTSDLRYWNNIRGNLIRTGQKLVVYVPKSKLSYYQDFNKMSYAEKQAQLGKTVSSKTHSPKRDEEKHDASYIYYTVQQGDNFWTIARKFPGVSNYDIMKLNHIEDAKSLKVGQKLKIKKRS